MTKDEMQVLKCAYCMMFFGYRLVLIIYKTLSYFLLQMYIGEISPKEYRFQLLAVGYVMYALGTIMVYLLGTYFSYWICAFVYGGWIAVTIPFMLFLPEPPFRTRNILKNVQKIVKTMKNVGNVYSELAGKIELGPFFNRIIMSNVVITFNSFMGYIVLVQYVGPILNVAGARNWSIPHGVLVAITMGGSDLIGSILAIILSKKLGHIISCSIGAMGVCLGHTGIAVYFILIDGLGPHSTGEIVSGNSSVSELCFFKPAINSDLGEKYSPLALISMSIVMVLMTTFWILQPHIIGIELFPNETRSLGMGISSSYKFLCHTIASFLFPFVERSIGTSLTFFILAFIAAIGAFLVPTLVPETKGRPMGERGDKFTIKRNWMEFLETIKSLLCCTISKNKP